MGNFFDTAMLAIRQAIEKNYNGNVTQAARALNVSVPTLRHMDKRRQEAKLRKRLSLSPKCYPDNNFVAQRSLS